ncbi:TetR/AcrR family transcriptional regulator [Actinophytocola oryzae]|uniref:TetR family transcriptional regulator n=1 Tax=Actinophytocola oryzae TaxID=502181 RepID=A0A4R7VAQ3_9PSEU|nr:TetR/AcrR family transcriptional regulator [Actinophytocola oryzae]TDV46060.1 TetR family transcriptional regulator [Actinophytocola oryzae]
MRVRRRLRPEERRQQLIDVAIGLYSRRPFEQVSVDDIADAAQVSRALFYRYFNGPADLFAAASRFAVDGLLVRLRAPRDGTPERLRLGVEEFLDFATQHEAAFVAVVRNSSAISSETGTLVDEVRHAILDLVRGGVGITGPAPLVDLTIWCWAAAMEEAMLCWLRDPVLGKDAFVDWMSRQLTGMLVATARHH